MLSLLVSDAGAIFFTAASKKKLSEGFLTRPMCLDLPRRSRRRRTDQSRACTRARRNVPFLLIPDSQENGGSGNVAPVPSSSFPPTALALTRAGTFLLACHVRRRRDLPGVVAPHPPTPPCRKTPWRLPSVLHRPAFLARPLSLVLSLDIMYTFLLPDAPL